MVLVDKLSSNVVYTLTQKNDPQSHHIIFPQKPKNKQHSWLSSDVYGNATLKQRASLTYGTV